MTGVVPSGAEIPPGVRLPKARRNELRKNVRSIPTVAKGLAKV